jgi:uncharacterized C2H2 Zn-finger protein
MAEKWQCPKCHTRLVKDGDLARGVDKSGNNLPFMACPRCDRTFGLRDDGQIVPAVLIPS